MTYEDLLRDLENGHFAPVYALHGEEPFFIDQIEEAIEKRALPEAEKGFNQTVVYGRDADPLSMLDVLRRYPMMSARQVVILREAQEMKGLGELTSYVDNPMPTTVFVICFKHKKIDMTTRFGKALKASKSAVVFESKKLYDNQVADWIARLCKGRKLAIDTDATALLAEYLGADLARIHNELDKLAINLRPGEKVTTQHVQDFVGISKDYNLFELQKALAARDKPRIARIEHHFEANIKKNPLLGTIASLYNFFSKVYMLYFLRGESDAAVVKALELRSDWFLRDYKTAAQHYTASQVAAIIGLLREYDLRCKGVGGDTTNTGEEELMKELFFRILHS